MERPAEGVEKGDSLARMMANPGALSPPHCHPDCNEVIHLAAGSVLQLQGEGWISLESGDT